MKRNLIVLMIIGMIFTGCAKSTEINNGSSTVTSPRPTLTLTLTLTPSPSMMPSMTVVPTLSTEAAHSYFLELLLQNGGCSLPCWWGIKPGKSTTLDAKNILFPLTGRASLDLSAYDHGSLQITYPKSDTETDLLLAYYSVLHDNIIDVITISTQAFHVKNIDSDKDPSFYGSADYNKLFNSYTLQGILSTYGPPSDVFLYVENNAAEPNAPSFIELRLMYTDKGIFVKYSSHLDARNGNYLSCPSKAFVSLWLLSPEGRLAYQDALSNVSDWSDIFPKNYGKSLKDMTQMTIDNFYNTFKQPTEACIETPISLWPNR
jgi:hypothetical protein